MWSAEELLDFKKKLEGRTADFAAMIFRFLDDLPVTVSSKVLSFQLGKSASSIGANYREANRAESADDFIHKIGIVLKECSETVYWIELLHKLYPDKLEIDDLIRECDEFIRIFQSIRTKMYKNRKAKQ